MSSTTQRLWDRMIAHDDVTLQASALQAWLLVTACQLTYAHPQLGADLKKHMRDMGERFAQLFADDAEIMALIEAGWQREHDVDHDEPMEETDAHVERIISARFN